MASLLTQSDLRSVVIFPGMELPIKYRAKVRQCRVEEVQIAKGYIRVFDIDINGYRTFKMKEIGK